MKDETSEKRDNCEERSDFVSSHPPLRSFIKCASKHHIAAVFRSKSGLARRQSSRSHRRHHLFSPNENCCRVNKGRSGRRKKKTKKNPKREKHTKHTHDPNLLFSPRRLPRQQHHHHSEYLPSRTRRNQPSWISSSSFSSQTLRRT